MKGATECARERAAGRLLRRQPVYRPPTTIVDQRHGNDLHVQAADSVAAAARGPLAASDHGSLKRTRWAPCFSSIIWNNCETESRVWANIYVVCEWICKVMSDQNRV